MVCVASSCCAVRRGTDLNGGKRSPWPARSSTAAASRYAAIEGTSKAIKENGMHSVDKAKRATRAERAHSAHGAIRDALSLPAPHLSVLYLQDSHQVAPQKQKRGRLSITLGCPLRIRGPVLLPLPYLLFQTRPHIVPRLIAYARRPTGVRPPQAARLRLLLCLYL
jgi:hypothetical protein